MLRCQQHPTEDQQHCGTDEAGGAGGGLPTGAGCIHLSNGTLTLDGSFTEGRPKIVRSRLSVAFQPDAPRPGLWLSFLDGLLYPEDIPTLQEFIGYCLIPSNKGQRMMVLKGSGGEGKSQIGAVLSALFGGNMKDGSIGKISENRFARADLEDILLCVDDDMRMEALRQTNYVKSIVTAQGKMDLERKGRQSYQGWMFARLLAFSNRLAVPLDRSDGFYRRQLVLTTRERPAGRVDDPDLAEKMKAEVEGIFLWAFEGLRRLVSNNFKFTESQRTRANREAVKRDNNNVFDFLESEGYIRLRADASISSKELYEVYQVYCAENGLTAMKPRSFSDVVIASQGKYHLEYCNNVTNAAGRRVRGFWGSRRWSIPIYRCFPVIRCVRTYRGIRRRADGAGALYVRTQHLTPIPHIFRRPGLWRRGRWASVRLRPRQRERFYRPVLEQTRNCENIRRRPHPFRRTAVHGFAHPVRRLVRLQPEGRKVTQFHKLQKFSVDLRYTTACSYRMADTV